jgi:hypothetical protein
MLGSFWKYPHEWFVKYIDLLSEQMKAQGSPFSPESVIQFGQAWQLSWLTASSLAWGCIAFLVIFDILIALAVIFILTRSSVKTLFR